MTENIPGRFRQWFTAFAFTSLEQAADAMAEASRWGWLPALSGVAVGADHARARHDESTASVG